MEPSDSAAISKTEAQRRGSPSKPEGLTSRGMTQQAMSERKPSIKKTKLP